MEYTPAKDPEYVKALGRTPVRRSKKRQLQDEGVILTPEKPHLYEGGEEWERFRNNVFQLVVQKHLASKGIENPPNLVQGNDFTFEISSELWLYIFSFLDVQSLARVAEVSKEWYNNSRDDYVWKAHYIGLFYGQTRHFYQPDKQKCSFGFAQGSNSNSEAPEVVCTSILHYVRPTKDKKKPSHKNKYFLRTAERLFWLLQFQLNICASIIRQANVYSMTPEEVDRRVVQYSKENYNMKTRFICVFRSLYPVKYANMTIDNFKDMLAPKPTPVASV